MDVSLQQQRLRHIVDSYSLAGEETERFDLQLNDLTEHYPWPLVEIALVETLVHNWLRYPFPRGQAFLDQVRSRLQDWHAAAAAATFLTASQFEQVTGLAFLGTAALPASPGEAGLDAQSLPPSLTDAGEA